MSHVALGLTRDTGIALASHPDVSDTIDIISVKGCAMPDVLVRDVPPAVLRRVDEQAERLRLSRNEFLRRQLTEWAGQQSDRALGADDWAAFDTDFADLSDATVMAQAWR